MSELLALDVCTEIVERVAASYARNYSTSRDDFRQEGWIAILRARQTWSPESGTPREAYCYRACVLSCWSWIRRTHAPLSGSNRDLAERADLRTERPGALEPSCLVTPRQLRDENAERALEARELLGQVLTSLREGGTSAEMAAEVLLEGRTPADVARSRGVSVGRVWQVVSLWRRQLKAESVREFMAS